MGRVYRRYRCNRQWRGSPKNPLTLSGLTSEKVAVLFCTFFSFFLSSLSLFPSFSHSSHYGAQLHRIICLSVDYFAKKKKKNFKKIYKNTKKMERSLTRFIVHTRMYKYIICDLCKGAIVARSRQFKMQHE